MSDFSETLTDTRPPVAIPTKTSDGGMQGIAWKDQTWVVAPEGTPASTDQAGTTSGEYILNATDPFDVFGGKDKIKSIQDLRAAYRQLAWDYHPDGSSDPNATPIFQKIVQARYDVEAALKQSGALPEEKIAEIGEPLQLESGLESISGDKAVEAFAGSKVVEELKQLSAEGKVGPIPPDIEKLKEEGGVGWKEALTLVLFISVDLTFNGGRGLSSMLEHVLNNTINYRILIPAFKKMGMDPKTIESIAGRGSKAAKGIFELQGTVMEPVIRNMTKLQLVDLVNALTPEEQTKLLFSDSPEDPYHRLNATTVKQLFNESTLGKDYVDKLRSKIAPEQKQ